MRGSLSARLALWCAAVSLAAGPAYADGSTPRSVSAAGTAWNGWETQDWPQGGQDSDRQKNYTAPFTNAPYLACSEGGPGGGGGGVQVAGPFTVDQDVNSEPVTVFVPGVSTLFGPHALGILQKDDDLIAMANIVTWRTSPCYWKELNVSSWCQGSYTGTPALVNEEATGKITIPSETGGRNASVSYGVVSIYALSNGGCLGKAIVLTICVVEAIQQAAARILTAESMGSIPRATDYNLDFGYGLTMDETGLFCAGGQPKKEYWGDNGLYFQSGIIFAYDKATLGERWRTALQVGSDSTGPLPKGQEPPEAAERYHPTTPVVVNGSLAVVGCVGYHDAWNSSGKYDAEFTYALMGFDTKDGHRRWYVNVDSAILPTPAIAGDIVIFGTKNGRAYGVQRSDTNPAMDGILKWQTEWSKRITYRTQPYNVAEQTADTWLTGPAIDGNGTYAYFGGSDGRVHQFAVASGSVRSSETLHYYSRVSSYGDTWVYGEHDANGLVVYRPCPIYTPPAVYKNQCVFVKARTEGGTPHNGAFVFVLNLPDLTFNKSIHAGTWVHLNTNQAVFKAGGEDYGGFSFNGSVETSFDTIRQVPFIRDPGWGFSLQYNYATNTYPLPEGGIAISNGFLMASDLDSNRVAFVPSSNEYHPPTLSGTMGPFGIPPPGPAEPFTPAPLGPVEVYPNPFDPGKAVGGTVKFRNLPTDSTIELYTLAYERVRMLRESSHRAEWNGANEAGQQVAAGVYLFKVFIPGNVPPVTGRIALTRR